MKVFLAGRVAAETDGVVIDERRFPGRQGRLLFAYLVAEQGRPVSRDELAEALWGDAPPPTWDKALSVVVSKLRALLSENGVDGQRALTAAFGCYRLELPEGSSVDVLEAKSAARDAEALLAANEPEQAADAAAFAEAVVRQTFLPGDDGPWVESKRRELAGVRATALSVLAEASLSMDKAGDAVRWADLAIEAEPFRESSYRLLMAAHIAAGNRAEALRVYERCRRLLADELGTYPSPETESIYRDLLETPTHEGLTAAGVPPPSGEARPRGRRRRRNVLALAVGLVTGVAAAVFALTSSGGAAGKLLPDSLIRINPKTLKTTELAQVGDAPDLIAASGGYLWVTNNILRDSASSGISATGQHTLVRVDPSTGATEVVGGVEPCGITPDPSGDVWVANCFPPPLGETSSIVRVDATTLKFKKTIVVPGGSFFYRGITYGDGSVWLSNPSSSGLTEVDPQTRAVKTLSVNACCALASDDYGDVWMTKFHGGSLARVYLATGTVQRIVGAGVNPTSVAPYGNVIWFADWGAPQVLRVSATGPGHPRAIRLPIPTGKPSAVWTVAAGAGYIWAAAPYARAVFRIDPETNHWTRIPLPYQPAGVTVDSDNNVWVTVRGR